MSADDRLLSLAEAVCDRRPIDLNSYLELSPAAERPALSLLAALVNQVWTVEPKDEVAPLTRWGRFELLSQLGRGAFGEVYRAWDPHFEREVAVKLRHSGLDESAGTRDALLAEGRLLARLDHPGVARVYELGEYEGRFGLVMERVEGETLAQLVERGRPSAPAQVAAFGVELANALAALHEAKIVHRDLKAQNVIVRPDGRLVLVDFGIGFDLSKPSDEELVVSGTPLYMAPELFEGARPTPASDLYSLGVLLFHLLTGEFPVEAETVADLRAAHGQSTPTTIRRRLGGVPRGLRQVIGRCLAAQPEVRGAGAAGVARKLRPWKRESRMAQYRRQGAMLAALLATVGLSRAVDLDRLLAFQGKALSSLGTAARPIEVSCRERAEQAGEARTRGELRRALDLAQTLGHCREPFARGVHLATRRQYPEAAEAFRLVSEEDPRFEDAWRQRIHHLANLGRHPEAILEAERLVERFPTIGSTELLAMYLEYEERFQEALERIETARVAGYPGDSTLLSWPEGVAHLGLEQYDRARLVLRRLGASGQDDTARQAARSRLAVVETLAGNPREARRLLENSLSANQAGFFQLREILALARMAQERGDGTEFLRRLQSIARLEAIPAFLPEFRAALRFAALAKRWEIFAEFAQKLEEIDRRWPSAMSRAAFLQAQALGAVRSGDGHAARQSLEEAQHVWWPDPEILLTKLQITDALESRAEACPTLKTLVHERRGDFLWNGIAYEWKLLADRYSRQCRPVVR